jgi:serine/threonine protein kinase
MPFYANGDMTSLVQRANKVEEEIILRVGVQVASALSYLHTLFPAPIVHRDIKPENLLWDGKDVVLTDLETIRFLDATYVNGATGTYPYQAPEQIERDQTCTKTDIWSLGCVLFVLSMQPEFPMPMHIELTRLGYNAFQKYVMDSVKGRGYSNHLSCVIAMALRNPPEERPTARQFCDNLSHLLNDRTS